MRDLCTDRTRSLNAPKPANPQPLLPVPRLLSILLDNTSAASSGQGSLLDHLAPDNFPRQNSLLLGLPGLGQKVFRAWGFKIEGFKASMRQFSKAWVPG